jgi:hypothetical protein
MTQTPNPSSTDPSLEPETAPAPSARPAPRPPRRRYKIRGPETWALIRESYLAGGSARELAARYDVTEWAIWRRAWKENWTKLDRVEPRPAPALEPLTPGAASGEGEGGWAGAPSGIGAGAVAPEPSDLLRRALIGLDAALRQSRLAEARNLAQIAGALERLGGAGGGASKGGGGFTLEDMYRAMFDKVYRSEVMDMSRDSVRNPVKSAYWSRLRTEDQAEGDALARIMSQGFREGRDATLKALGHEPGPEEPDEYVWHARSLVRRAVLAAKTVQWEAAPASQDP